jgi:hypothetical protein
LEDDAESKKMSDSKIVKYTAQELEERRSKGIPTGADWERIAALTDEDIEQAVKDDPDAAPLIGKDFWKNAKAAK